MKKRFLSITMVSIALLFLLTGCGNKTVKTTEEFRQIAQAHDYTVADVSGQYADYEHIIEATVAKKDDYQIDFYVIDGVENATILFNNNKQIFENSKGSSSSKVTSNIGNYSSYALNSNGKYNYICRVENTLVYINVDEEYKDEVKAIIKELGY